MLTRTLEIVGVLGVLVAAQACSAEAPADATAAESNVVLNVQSPNANPDSAYLKSRRLDSLVRLGALQGDLARLASRADGTLDPAAADGKLTLDELLALDKSENLQKLIPQERAVLPALWKLLETTKADATELTVPAVDALLANDVSEPAVDPVEPTSIPVSSLKTELQRVGVRLEQAHDSDDNPKTITKDDLAAALAAPAGFQPWELAQLKTIQDLFRERAGTKLVAKAKVTPPVTPPYTIPPAITWGPASIGISKTVEYLESRLMDLTTGTLTVKVVGHVSQNAKLSLPTANQLLLIDDETGSEVFASSGVLELDAGTKTVEVWSGGARVGSFRSKLPKLAATDTTVDLSQYADYAFVLEDGKALNHHSVDGAQTESAFTISYKYEKDGYDAYVSDVIKQGAANPPFNVAAGRYVLPSPDGNITLELYPEGILKITRANGISERAIYANRVWTLPDASDLKFTFDPNTNSVTIRKADETLLFQGALSGSLRTG
jgi:hypothetical protein